METLSNMNSFWKMFFGLLLDISDWRTTEKLPVSIFRIAVPLQGETDENKNHQFIIYLFGPYSCLRIFTHASVFRGSVHICSLGKLKIIPKACVLLGL